ncbi:uracil/xanthine transporter [Xylanibacillus composti]|uniref:Purine permease n=1 Tax=Xylanibacillus composti TaxID=1572762 RepID=A0A8J4H4P2_9BACL|nr:uracil/xanthine transporter [Xylanibacillus composti]MDT9724070.1 uracil/xanthine transporter [Xylanibacillus composti]GIQ69462.1 purine permease [Xylanibacillus composti]
MNSSKWTMPFASMQWLFFIFANTVVVPLSVGTAFDLPAHEIAGTLRSSLLFTGLACVLQGLFGHRLPLMEGHSGVMWGLVLTMSLSSSALGMSLPDIGGGIATGMLLAGAAIALLALCNGLTFMQKLFSPMVLSVFLLLLTFQLILIFFDGMLVIRADGTLDIPVTAFAFGIMLFVIALKVSGIQAISSFSILIGMAGGWIGYVWLFPTAAAYQTPGLLAFPVFPFGAPNLNLGIVMVTFLATFLNLSNTVAAVQTASKLLDQPVSQKQFNRSYILTGSYSVGAAVLGLVSYAPFASSIGFLESTRIFQRKPFLIGGGLMALLGLFPMLGGLLAALPISVGNAVLFAAYLQLFGTALQSVKAFDFDSVSIHRIALPVLIGIGLMFTDPGLFGSLPVLIQPLVTNGFVVGVLLSIVLEFKKWD